MGEGVDHTRILQSWLGQLQASDGASFEDARSAVMSHVAGRLESLVRKMLKNYPRLRRWEQTGDVLQNALLRLHRSLSTVRPDSARQFYGLAATQIRRELIDLTRHYFGPEGAAAKHHTDFIGRAADHDATVDSLPDSTGEPSSLEDWTRFHEAVQKLPALEREVFDLYWYEGIDQKQIASLLNVTDRTIKNRWRSAKLRLKSLLTEDGSEGVVQNDE